MLKKQCINFQKPDDLTFWQSYSDMMAALLLVFVLIIAFYVSTLTKATEVYNLKIAELDVKDKKISEYQVTLKLKENELDKQKSAFQQQQIQIDNQRLAFKQQQTQIDNQRLAFKQQQTQIDNQQLAFKQQQTQIDKLIGIRSELIQKLREAFDATSMGVSVSPETGAISFDSKILFDLNSYILKDSGITFLNIFFPQYFAIILDKELSRYIAEIIIEGHTDNSGKYLYNLELSQKRAFSVAEYCLNDQSAMFEATTLDNIRKLVTANGRAFYELKYSDNGEIDTTASRRVEIKFRLKAEEMIKEMAEILENKENSDSINLLPY